MKNILIVLILIIFYSCEEKKNNKKYNTVPQSKSLNRGSLHKFEKSVRGFSQTDSSISIYYPYINEFDIVNKDDIEFDCEYQYDCGHMSSYEDVYDTTYIIKRVCKKNCKKN